MWFICKRCDADVDQTGHYNSNNTTSSSNKSRRKRKNKKKVKQVQNDFFFSHRTFSISTFTIYFILKRQAHLWQIAIWPTCLMITWIRISFHIFFSFLFHFVFRCNFFFLELYFNLWLAHFLQLCTVCFCAETTMVIEFEMCKIGLQKWPTLNASIGRLVQFNARFNLIFFRWFNIIYFVGVLHTIN